MQLSVGKDLFSVCGKCGAQWHVVVAMDDARVTKVQCKHCMGYHRYRVPPGEVDVNAAAKRTRRKVPAPSKSSTPSPKRRTRRADEPQIDPDLSRPVRGYASHDTYAPGERIEHPKFGQGVVEALPSPGKIDVFFEQGRRTLVHGRGAPAAAS